jgi:hypothetical protein
MKALTKLFQFEIEGAADEVRDFERAVNASIQEFKNVSTVVKKSVNMVTKMST